MDASPGAGLECAGTLSKREAPLGHNQRRSLGPNYA